MSRNRVEVKWTMHVTTSCRSEGRDGDSSWDKGTKPSLSRKLAKSMPSHATRCHSGSYRISRNSEQTHVTHGTSLSSLRRRHFHRHLFLELLGLLRRKISSKATNALSLEAARFRKQMIRLWVGRRGEAVPCLCDPF